MFSKSYRENFRTSAGRRSKSSGASHIKYACLSGSGLECFALICLIEKPGLFMPFHPYIGTGPSPPRLWWKSSKLS